MNAKNIISAILMVLSFTACSSEIEGIDDNMTNTGANNGETSISVRMMTEGISTKADTQSEKLISNYVIAVFEKKSSSSTPFCSKSSCVNVQRSEPFSIFSNFILYHSLTKVTVCRHPAHF